MLFFINMNKIFEPFILDKRIINIMRTVHKYFKEIIKKITIR